MLLKLPGLQIWSDTNATKIAQLYGLGVSFPLGVAPPWYRLKKLAQALS